MASEAGGGARRPSVSDRGGRVQHCKYLLVVIGNVLSCPVLYGYVCSGDAPWQQSAVRLRGHGKDMGRAYSDLASAGRRMYGVLSSFAYCATT
jgi:hypothetical protein